MSPGCVLGYVFTSCAALKGSAFERTRVAFRLGWRWQTKKWHKVYPSFSRRQITWWEENARNSADGSATFACVVWPQVPRCLVPLWKKRTRSTWQSLRTRLRFFASGTNSSRESSIASPPYSQRPLGKRTKAWLHEAASFWKKLFRKRFYFGSPLKLFSETSL